MTDIQLGNADFDTLADVLKGNVIVADGLTGAVAASRYVGATASGAPASGTFVTGDFVITQDGHVFICTAGGTPGTWADAGGSGGASGGTPALTLSTANGAGSATTFIRTDDTILAFDATAPVTQAMGDSAAVGTATVTARRDHKHGMPALGTTAAAIGTSAGGSATTPSKSDHVHATGAGTPSTQAFGDAAATGSGPAAAMTDHKHAMPANPVSTDQKTRAIEIVIDGGGSVLTTGMKGYIEVPFGCTINRATLLADQSGSVVVNIYKCTYSQFDAGSTHPVVGDKITASAPPTISSATKAQDSTLTSWTTSLSAGDILAYNVDSVTTIQRVTVSLKVTVT